MPTAKRTYSICITHRKDTKLFEVEATSAKVAIARVLGGAHQAGLKRATLGPNPTEPAAGERIVIVIDKPKSRR